MFDRILSALVIAACLALAACAPVPVAERDLSGGLAALERELERMERRGFAGQVVVARGDEVLLISGYGTLAPGDDEPVTPDSVMPLASLTKPFTGSAILALAADGKLNLDDPIGRHLPELQSPWAEVPIESLLTHSAGLPAEIINRAWEGHPQFEPVDRTTFLQRIGYFPPDHPPGGGFNYSNVGYSVLGAVVERASGRNWESWLRERLLIPAGVEDIGLLGPGWSPERRVRGRQGGEDWGSFFDQPGLDDGLGWQLRASGDLHGTARGISDWWRAVYDRRWLPGEQFREWLKPRVREPDGTRYGYGLHFRETPFGPVIGHSGGNRIFSVDFSWFTDGDVMVYIASSQSRFQADLIRDDLHRRLLGHGRQPPGSIRNRQ